MLERLKSIYAELSDMEPVLKRHKELNEEIVIIMKNCEHKNAYEHGQSRKDYEGRLYAHIICEDCRHMWSERIGKNGSGYEKWDFTKLSTK